MGKIFDDELNRIKDIQAYNTERASGMLDDLASAYISASEFNGLDNSLIAIRTGKKALRAVGHSKAIVNDYFIERSYLSKTRLKSFKNDSIYTDSGLIRHDIESIKDRESSLPVNDLIIEELKSRPALLTALKNGYSRQYINQAFKIDKSIALKNFYNQYKNIID